MKENVLDILIYLFENYMLEINDDEPDEDAIMSELMQAGFHHVTIDHAFDWLENLAIMCEEHEINSPSQNINNAIPSENATASTASYSMRQFHPYEKDRLDVKAQGLLLSLEQCGVLSPFSREMVIDRLMALNIDNIDLHHIKWVILMVISNCTDNHAMMSNITEALLMDGAKNRRH